MAISVNLNGLTNITSQPLYQWDRAQNIYVSGVTESGVKFHCCNVMSKKAKVLTPTLRTDDMFITIPNELLEEPYEITLYGYSSGRTIFEIHIPIIKRPQPDGIY